ncbi:hypothetical protein KDH83_28690, partial [Achromobacter sp. Marseille-Q0513]|uniref:hypothetical protein n=1 Tax=Achromobacter sp. Marseille-Q0513 TaxID=2829161 RepID=UPI001B8F121E
MTTTIPAGWKLVPEIMTLDMCVAFAEAWFSKVRCIDDHDMQDAYAAMLAEAPAAPGVSTVEDAEDEQTAFERWCDRMCPSGDANEVQRQWEASSDYADFHAPAAGDAQDAHFDLWQDDMVVASASGPRSQALQEIQHYAAVYSQDGPVQIEEVIRIPLNAAQQGE